MSSFKKYKTLLPIIVVMATAIGIVAILSWTAKDPTFGKNGFTRRVDNIGIKMINAIAKDADIMHVCGIANNHLYFKTKVPGKILETDYSLKNAKYLNFDVPNTTKIVSSFS